MRSLVTGAGGFIGSHLTERLLREGHEVRAFVRYTSTASKGWLEELPSELLDGVEFVWGDVRDQEAVTEAVRGCETVYHLAALIGIPYSYRSPASYIQTNVTGTLNILQAARSLNPSRVVVTSTSEVYGSARHVPIDEDHPLQGQSPYSASKIAADQLANAYFASFELPVAIVRPFNTYGPKQSTRAVIPTILTQVADGFQEISLGATEPTRDFCYVDDTVSGFVAVARSDAAIGEVVNIGTGFEISIGDLVRLIGRVCGQDIRVATDPDRIRPEKSEVTRLVADARKAQTLLGWKPTFAGREGLSKGITKTREWLSTRTDTRLSVSGEYVV